MKRLLSSFLSVMERLGLSLIVMVLITVFSSCSSTFSSASSSIGEQSEWLFPVEPSYINDTPQPSLDNNANQEPVTDTVDALSSNESCLMSTQDDLSQYETGNDMWNFETDRIEIYCDTDEFSVPIEIIDTSTIAVIVDAINISAWDKVDLENEIPESPGYYIDFCNGTVISMLSDTGYGCIGSSLFREYNDDGNLIAFGLESSQGPYLFNDNLKDVIEKIMEST